MNKEYKNWNTKSLFNGVEKYRIGHRTKKINAGTILVDDKYYFYAQKKFVRIKGSNEQIKVISFKHFYDQFLKENKVNLGYTPLEMLQQFGLEKDTQWIDDDTVLIKDKYYYNFKTKQANVNGGKPYSMRGFEHFHVVFLL